MIIETTLFIATVLCTPSTDSLDRITQRLASTETSLAFFTPGVLPTTLDSLTHQLDTIERDIRSERIEIDTNPGLLTNPTLRQRRSDLAVDALHFRIPIARARVLAYDPTTRSTTLREAVDSLGEIDYAWGRASLERHAALGALHWRLRDHEAALAAWNRADPADPLVRFGTLAAAAALDRLESLPRTDHAVRVAIAGAAHGRGPVAAQRLAIETIGLAAAGRVDTVRTAVFDTLAALRPTPGDPPLVTIARTSDAAALRPLTQHDDPVIAAEAHLKLWSVDPSETNSVLEASLAHPAADARRRAAALATPYLLEADADLALRCARSYLQAWAGDALADRWRLAVGTHGAPAEALAALDLISDSSLVGVARLQAAIKSREAMRVNPSAHADDCAARVRAARTAITDPATRARWGEWLWDAEAEAVAASSGLGAAALAVLDAPPEECTVAARRLAPQIFERARHAEAIADTDSMRRWASIGAQIARLALLPVLEARCLTLAGDAERALDILSAVNTAHGEPYGVMLARAEALVHLGRDGEAFPLYRAIAESHEAHRRDTDAFWRSWTRMLQIIERQTGTEDRYGDIAREIKRLKILDSQLGGDPHRRRLQLLLQTASATPSAPPR